MAKNSTAVVNHDHRSLSETSSRCFTESLTATHNFEVACYPLLAGMGVGKYISSCIFSVGGYDWTIRFYPDGNNAECAGNASAFLYCSSQPEGVRTKFTLNMLEKEGKVLVTSFGSLEHTFSSSIDDFGFSKFVEKSRLLKSSSDATSGYFTIRCVLTVIKEPRTEIRRNLFVVPRPNLQDHLQQMWKDGHGADVTFSVSGQLFSAHRYLLAARSPVFKAELFGPTKEKATDSITIDDIEPSIFEALLHFIYTDSILDDWDSKEDRYGLERLRVMCEGRLRHSIDLETVATTLVLAEQHHCRDLKEACIGFMTSQNRLGDIMATDGFKHLMASSPLIMKDILDKVSCVLSG
ncbi:BTB/POZ and MATH domain-containing protein 2-like [Triticum urartu]|uniref:BTB/POZ and MATH domain-containing protein 2-like n=1 Tax=Triticum urartu TaxID=4572 RepID=UPI0020433FF8|nr:BTB/POZ and MATH domain-containing protein 2-like [Triticum urartu]